MLDKVLDTRIIARLDKFEPLPDVLRRLRDEIARPNTDHAQVAAIVREDPVIYGRIMKLSNSTAVGAKQQIRSIEQAISLVGLDFVEKLVFSIFAAQTLSGTYANFQGEAKGLVKQSIATAVIAEKLARQLKIQLANEAYSAGLMHDMGKIVLNGFIKPKQSELKQMICEDGLHFSEAERTLFGITHAELGSEICRKWGFSEAAQYAVRYHHDPLTLLALPDVALATKQLVAVVHIADAMVNSLLIRTLADVERQAYPMHYEAMEFLKMDEKTTEQFFEMCRATVEPMLAEFLGMME